MLELQRPPPKSVAPSHLGELAWVIVELCHIARHLQEQGWCVGELRAGHLSQVRGTLHRVASDRPWRRFIDVARVRMHERFQHDRGCGAFGVSERVLTRLVTREWRDVAGGRLLLEALQDSFTELEHIDGYTAAEILEWQVRIRVTPVRIT